MGMLDSISAKKRCNWQPLGVISPREYSDRRFMMTFEDNASGRTAANDVVHQLMAEPFVIYGELRQTHPVVWVSELNRWLVTTYDGVREGLTDPRLGQYPPNYLGLTEHERYVEEFFDRWLVFTSDSDYHDSVRRRISPAFARPRSAHHSEALECAIIEFISGITPGPIEVVSGLADPLASRVVQVLLDIPETSLPWLIDLADVILGYLGETSDATTTSHAISELLSYTGQYSPTSVIYGGSWIAHILQSVQSDLDRAAVFAQLLTGSFRPMSVLLTTAIWGGSFYWNKVGASDVRSGIIEEALRYDSPFHFVPRTALVDLRDYDRTIAAGDELYLVLASANRDETVFPSPDRFTLENGRTGHLAFGRGDHSCLGAPTTRFLIDRILFHLQRRFSGLDVYEEMTRVPTLGATVYKDFIVSLRF